MKAAKMRELTLAELEQHCAELERELLTLRIRKSAGQIEQPSRLRLLRREIARAQTVLRERRKTAQGG